MSLMPKFRNCKKCGKMYSWNPSVGKLNDKLCPECWEKELKKVDKLNTIFRKKK